MADDTLLKNLTEDTAPTSDDLVYVLNDPAGTPGNKKVTLANLAKGVGTAWASFTPSYTGLSVGNGTNNGYYDVRGKTVVVKTELTFGTTSTFTTNPVLTLPVTAASRLASSILGQTANEDVGNNIYWGAVIWVSTTTAQFYLHNASTTTASIGNYSSTVPFTWGTGDKMSSIFTYEAG